MTKRKTDLKWMVLATMAIWSAGCTKFNLEDDYPVGDPPPIGAYTNSNEIAPAELVAHFPFEGNGTDAKGSVPGGTLSGPGSYTAGKKGLAFQGANNAFLSYTSAGVLGNLTSFTVSLWVNTNRHGGGAQGVFTVTKADGSFWGNFFLMIEGAGAADGMLTKVHFEKNTTPPVSNVEHWLETTGTLRSGPMRDMYGSWRHIAFTYDETTSKFAQYASGNPLPFPDATVNRMANATTPLGALAFKNPARFIIGGFQNQLGAPYNSPEPWMLTYTGKVDELRFYKKALSATEVNLIFQLEKQGR